MLKNSVKHGDQKRLELVLRCGGSDSFQGLWVAQKKLVWNTNVTNSVFLLAIVAAHPSTVPTIIMHNIIHSMQLQWQDAYDHTLNWPSVCKVLNILLCSDCNYANARDAQGMHVLQLFLPWTHVQGVKQLVLSVSVVSMEIARSQLLRHLSNSEA